MHDHPVHASGIHGERQPEKRRARPDTFDDRTSPTACIEDLSPALLRRARAGGGAAAAAGDQDLLRRLDLVAGVAGREVPRNAALLLFSEDPARFFPGARVEVARCGGPGGAPLEERVIRGPLQEQVRLAVEWVMGAAGELSARALGPAGLCPQPYPEEAVRELLLNAVEHRAYGKDQRPVRVVLFPDRLEVLNHSGSPPVLADQASDPVRPIPARNPRVSALLRELGLGQGKGAGIERVRGMARDAGAPNPVFESDVQRTYYRAVLFPPFPCVLPEVLRLWREGHPGPALEVLRAAFGREPAAAPALGLATLASLLITTAFAARRREVATRTLRDYRARAGPSRHAGPYLAMARGLIDRRRLTSAMTVLKSMPMPERPAELLEAGHLFQKFRLAHRAHAAFERAYQRAPSEPAHGYHLALCKIKLAKGRRLPAREKLLGEAAALLREVVAAGDAPPELVAPGWFHLARSLSGLRAPVSETRRAFKKALSLAPDLPRLAPTFRGWERRR